MINPRSRRRSGTSFAALAVAALLLAATGCSPGGSLRAGVNGVFGEPAVLLVHGYNPSSCPGADVTRGIWGLTYLAFTRAEWSGPVLPVSYYGCDRDGVDVTGYGPTVPSGAGPQISASTPRVRYDQNTSIDQLAHDLAWFVYHSFTDAGRPVDLVGISMGGLIIRDLLYRVAQHDPDFPPSVRVAHAVTFSTPYLGYGGTRASSICPIETLECREFAVGSPLIAELTADPELPQGAGGTRWALAGSSAGCDFVPATTSLAPTDALRIDYLVPCYTHPGYLADASLSADATARITEPDGSAQTVRTAEHSLAWLISTLSG